MMGVVFAVALAVSVVLAVVALGWVGVRGAIAADFLRSAKNSAAEVSKSLGNPAAAAAAIAEAAEDAATAHALTSDPVWRLVEVTPWVGPQLVAVSTVAAAADDIASDALGPLAEVASTLSPNMFRPTDGKVDLTGFLAVQDAARKAAAAMRSATASLDRINTAALVAPLRSVVEEVSATFTEADEATAALANASTLIPAMLGADGPRNYLVLFQNNAEWRSLGGIAGAMVVVGTDGGTMQLVANDAATAFAPTESAVLPLSDEITDIYGEHPGRWMQNVTQVPDFSVSAALAREMWARKHGAQVDGVIATDPVALSYILAATGPVRLASGDTLTAENAVSLLMNEVYLRYPKPSDQDAFFADATSAVFGALTAGSADPGKLLAAMGKAGDERRLLIWSAHDEDQEILADTTLAGGLPTTDSKRTTFGVYLNDGTGAKLDYYNTVETTVTWESCLMNAAGTAEGTATLTVTIHDNAPVDAANLPAYLTANGLFGVPTGATRTVGYLYMPSGFELVSANMSNETGFGGGFHEGRQVISFQADLNPGESVTATATVRSIGPSGPTLVAQVTPTVNVNVTAPISTCL
jgi:hypothetical protein